MSKKSNLQWSSIDHRKSESETLNSSHFYWASWAWWETFSESSSLTTTNNQFFKDIRNLKKTSQLILQSS